MRILAADIGGTKTLLQVADYHGKRFHLVHEQRFHSAAFDDFHQLLGKFLAETQEPTSPIHSACLAVAGPVQEQGKQQTASVTNLPWTLDSARLAEAFNIPSVRLINDFQAVGYGVQTLNEHELYALQAGERLVRAPALVIGAGTGLGAGQLIWCQDHYQIIASEYGHADFAPTDPLQAELWQFLRQRLGRVAIEAVLSGPGLVSIYQFFCSRQPAAISWQLQQRLSTGDSAAAISEYAQEHQDPLACQALALLVSIYGAQAGNLALVNLAQGGVYIAGGIAPRILGQLRGGNFINAFNNKGKMSHLMEKFPVVVVMDPKVGLRGAALVATLRK